MKRKWIAVLLGLALAVGLAACATSGVDDIPPNDNVSVGGSAEDGALGAGSPDAGDSMAAAVTCPVNMTPDEKNTYPYMGVSIQLPEHLLNAVLDNVVFMRVDENVEYTDLGDSNRVPMDWRPTAENTILHGGGIEFLYVPADMQDRTPRMGMEDPMLYDEFEIWVKDTAPMARLGMYRKADFQEKMLDETGYAQHDKLGESAEYLYYLSTNPVTDDMPQEATEIFATQNELKNGISIFDARPVDDYYFGLTTPEVDFVSNVGDFSTETLNGQTIDQTIFSGKKLTMVNAWTTWCGACIEEMPDLEALSKELENTDAQVISIVCDTYDARDGVNEELLELAQRIKERTDVTFPTLIPDKNLKDGLLQGILGYPTTWFVDEDGNIIGDPVLGSNSKEDWMALIQERLAEVDP